MISIADLAKAVGVSSSTVSRALNGKKGVSDEVRDQILKLSQKMGYEPNDVARALITKRSGLIGLIIPDMLSLYYNSIAKGVSDYLMEHGKNVLFCSSQRDPKKEEQCIALLKRHQVEGIVLISVTADDRTVISMQSSGIKVISADNVVSSLCTSVINDNYRGARELFAHMASSGCRKIGWIGGIGRAFTTRERMRALNDTVEEGLLSLRSQDVIYAESTSQNGYQCAEKLIANKVDAIFGVNDQVAIGIMKYCFDHGIRVPEDLKIAGFDDLDVSAMLSVPLTTVHQRKIRLGRKAAELMLAQINHPDEPVKVVLDPWLVKRRSCGEI